MIRGEASAEFFKEVEMTPTEAFALGVMMAFTPSMVVLAYLLWIAPTAESEAELPQSRKAERSST